MFFLGQKLEMSNNNTKNREQRTNADATLWSARYGESGFRTGPVIRLPLSSLVIDYCNILAVFAAMRAMELAVLKVVRRESGTQTASFDSWLHCGSSRRSAARRNRTS